MFVYHITLDRRNFNVVASSVSSAIAVVLAYAESRDGYPSHEDDISELRRGDSVHAVEPS